jgi:RNA polymerase sigma-70 factor, ECF subfamily
MAQPSQYVIPTLERSEKEGHYDRWNGQCSIRTTVPQVALIFAFFKRIPNDFPVKTVFMFEDPKLAAGDMSLGQVMPLEKTRTESDQLELVVREHAQLVYRIAFSVLRNHHDAEDATQETFLRVWKHGKKLPEVHEIKSWIARIAWRVAISKKRKVAEVSLEEIETISVQLRSLVSGAEEIVLQKEMSGVLGKLFATLPKKLREPIMLSTVEELSITDVGEVLGISEAAVRSCLFRARQILRERLLKLLDIHHGN